MDLLGTKKSLIFVICISYWPQLSLQSDDLTGIFCKKCFPILFNISQLIIVVRYVRAVLVFGHLKNINLLHFWKIHLLLVTIVSAKKWVKQEITAKSFLLALFSSFHLFVILTVLLLLWIIFIVGESIFIYFYHYWLCFYFYFFTLTAL